MSFYGSDPAPVSVEAANEDVTDALQVLQTPGNVDDGSDGDLGDGLRCGCNWPR